MNTKFDFSGGSDEQHQIVYVRKVDVEELPEDVRAQARAAGEIYAVHNTDGERLALVQGRELAFVLARQHDMAPVTVH